MFLPKSTTLLQILQLNRTDSTRRDEELRPGVDLGKCCVP